MPNNDLPTPVTTDQKFMAKAAGVTIDLPTPITPEQKYLKAIADGGTGGTSDYTDLTNKPAINGVTLAGDKSWEDLGLANPMHIAGSCATVADLPETATAGDVYLVGPADGIKDEYCYTGTEWEFIGDRVVVVDDALSTTSENPAQNKVVTVPLNAVVAKLTGINSTANNNIQMGNGLRLYISNTEPFAVGIPEGSVGLGW